MSAGAVGGLSTANLSREPAQPRSAVPERSFARVLQDCAGSRSNAELQTKSFAEGGLFHQAVAWKAAPPALVRPGPGTGTAPPVAELSLPGETLSSLIDAQPAQDMDARTGAHVGISGIAADGGADLLEPARGADRWQSAGRNATLAASTSGDPGEPVSEHVAIAARPRPAPAATLPYRVAVEALGAGVAVRITTLANADEQHLLADRIAGLLGRHGYLSSRVLVNGICRTPSGEGQDQWR